MNLHAQQLGKLGGLKSAHTQLAGKSDAEKSGIMRKLRYTKKELELLNATNKEFTESAVAALSAGVQRSEEHSNSIS